ncbi:MAG: hypothetical protein AAB649_03220 [Patescibacteria group bacterium]
MTESQKRHHGATQGILDLFQSHWGTSFVHSLTDKFLEQEMDVCASHYSLSKTVEADISIRINLRPLGEIILSNLADGEFFLSVLDVARLLKPDTQFLPDQLVLVCCGSSCYVTPEQFSRLVLVGQDKMFPKLTLTTTDGARKLRLDAVESGVLLEGAFVPVGILS